jgi:TolA-binding protein
MWLHFSIALLSLSPAARAEEPPASAPQAESSPAPAPTDANRAVDQASAQEKERANELWNRAMEAFARRNFSSSAKLFQEYIDRYPGTPEGIDARYSLAQSHLFGHEPKKAIPQFLSVIEVRGKSVLANEARTYLGQAYLDDSRYTEAYLVSEELLSQESLGSTFRAKALLMRAHAQAGMRQNLEAEKSLVAFQAIAESDPELERETAGSYLVSLLLKANHCDALPSAPALPEDQVLDQVARKSVCVLEMGTMLARASKRLESDELTAAADAVGASLASLRISCQNPPLERGKRTATKLELAKKELAEKLRESCDSAEKLLAETFRERDSLRPLRPRVFLRAATPIDPSPVPGAKIAPKTGARAPAPGAGKPAPKPVPSNASVKPQPERTP